MFLFYFFILFRFHVHGLIWSMDPFSWANNCFTVVFYLVQLNKVEKIGARLGYHPHIFSTMAESIAKTNENVAQKNANEEKNPVFFFNTRVESPIGVKQHTMAAGSSPLRSTLNTNVITGLDMCKVCTEAVHCVALWTQTLSQVWTCLKYVPKQSIAKHFEHERYHRFGHV